MNTSGLNPDDRVEVNRKGFVFTATLDTRVPAGWLIRDSVPTSSYLHVTARQIVKRVEGKQRPEEAE